ncbi:MAG: polymorphic toxin-type HINT domain-containing protein [Planctomycetota bacterium]
MRQFFQRRHSVRRILRYSLSGVLAAGICTHTTLDSRGVAAETPSPSSSESASKVANELAAEALKAECNGDLLQRQRLLAEAENAPDDSALAKSQLGQVQIDGRWLSVEQCVDSISRNVSLAEYERRRSRVQSTAENHFSFGRWCVSVGLIPQAKAHFERAIELDAGHTPAKRALGYQQAGQEWISPEQIQELRARSARTMQALQQFGSPLTAIRNRLSSNNEKDYTKAAAELMEINDPLAVVAAESIFNTASPQVANAVIQWLDQVDTIQSSKLLAKFALMHPQAAIQESAREVLSKRDLHEFVPGVIDMAVSPIFSSLVPAVNSDGTLAGYRQAFAQEDATSQRLVVLDTVYDRFRIQLIDGDAFSYRQTSDGAALNAEIESAVVRSARNETLARQATVQQRNMRTLVQNAQIAEFLSSVTGKEIPANARAIWQWWADENEMRIEKSREVRRSAIGHSIPHYESYEDSGRAGVAVPPTLTVSNLEMRPGRAADCLVAGTPVMTHRGLRAIETIATGDLVLTKSIQTGNLQWQPVISPTVRPPEPIFEIATVEGKLQSTGGHMHWVSGKGWIRARNIELGDVLHGAKGPTIVCNKRQLPAETTHNLRVSENANFFVGDELVLTHDVTERAPSRALVPGLHMASN